MLWNSAGAVLGAALFRAALNRTTPSARVRHTRSRWAWSFLTAALFPLAGVLLSPDLPDDEYWGQWTPDLGFMPQYGGQVVSAELNGDPFPSGKLMTAGPPRDLLVGDWTLGGRVVAGPHPTSVSPILSVFDGHEREILVLGAHGADLILRERTQGKRLRLDHPDLRFLDALSDAQAADSMRVGARRAGDLRCLVLGEIEQCELGFSPGRTWGLLMYLELPPEATRQIIDLLWLLVLFSPIGFFSLSAREAGVGGAVGFTGLATAVLLTRLVWGPWLELAACVGGVLLGRSCVTVGT